MPQKTNLNISPYYDDFDKADQFYKILFKPGFPVQARELTGLQSLLQNQVESFGKHIFKEGSMVIPGNIELDRSYFSAKINPTHLGIDVSIYLSNLIANNNGKGTRVRGQLSGTVATIKNFILPPAEGVDDITIFIKYQQSGNDGESAAFPDGEILILEEPLTYGNTTLTLGETVLTLVSSNATATGCAFGVNEGVYFMRGSFVDVPTSLIILEPYNNSPSYRVGFDISEEIINANDDESLYDNAKGFTNFAAPGADRFKISVKLAKKSLNDYEDTNFVELMRVDGGELKKLQNSASYSEIKQYFAKRTFDESGDYAVEPFRVTVQNSLNDEIDSAGLFTENRKTDQGNTPSEDLACVKLSPGKAYVRGFDVDLSGTTVLDVEKPRDQKRVESASIPFRMGSLLRVNNVQGTPLISLGGVATNVIQLQNRRKTGSSGQNNTQVGANIGQARVYSYSASNAPYTGQATQFDLFLYDIQTYTILQVTAGFSNVVKGSRVRGVASGAVGYLALDPNTTGANEFAVAETTGIFIPGEALVIDERNVNSNVSIKGIVAYTVDDIKSVFQDSDALDSDMPSNFSADAVLYERVLRGFSLTDQLNVTANTATVNNRSFAGLVGIQTGSIIAYQRGDSNTNGQIVYNRVTDLGLPTGKTLTLNSTSDVAGVNEGSVLSAGISTVSPFRIAVPRILNLEQSGIYADLPKSSVSVVDSGNSNLVISRQIKNQSISGNSISFSSQVGLNIASGITSVFFEPFDAERYSIHYTDGTTEPLTSDQVTITNGGANISFDGLSKASGNATVNVTLKKQGITSKTKDFIRSKKFEVTRTVGVSTLTSLLTPSNVYGLRVEDEEICLLVPDIVNIVAIYESKDTSTPVLDKLTFVSGLNLDTDSIIGEKIVGQDSRAIGQIVSATTNTIDFVYLNDSIFTIGEVIKFKESSIETILQDSTAGNYNNRTENYVLDKGHKKQYSDFSKIVRKNKSAIPSKKLLIIADQYQVASGNTGDVFTVNSYNQERYTRDIPRVDGRRASDILDLRPRVKEYNPSVNTGSPFAFNNRLFESTNPFVITPNESSLIGFSHYLGRIDKLVVNKNEEVQIYKGESSEFPVPPSTVSDSMEIAQISYPPYLYDTVREPQIRLRDNRRFTMRDIAALERRIVNLETITSLSALELDTKSFQVRDKDGLDRFKTGFVVNDFKDRNFIDFNPDSGSRCDVDVVNRELISAVDFWSMNPELGVASGIDIKTADVNSNLQLLDANCQKTGDLITLSYEEVDWIENPHATTAVNVNPFNVLVFSGNIQLDPPSDNWSRTIYVENTRQESTGARWAERSNVVGSEVVGRRTESLADFSIGHSMGGSTNVEINRNITTHRVEREFTNVLEGPSREFSYIESTKVDSDVDPFMRSRNVFFTAGNLKPFTRHYHFLDSGVPDIVPKVIEIEMSSGVFSVFEDVKVEVNGNEIGLFRSQAPNHKFGDSSRPEVGAGLGSPNRAIETYDVDPYDRNRPAPSSTYSATSKLFNTDCIGLANVEKYFGYVVKGAKLTGASSGAVATVTNIDLFSDNWGDILGSFFFRDPNRTPRPPVVFRTGTLTFRITSSAENVIVPFTGDAPLQSSGSASYLGTGTVITQNNVSVSLRNPPRPPDRPNSFSTEETSELGVRTTFEAPDDDPLAQSFTVDGSGAFLTSFDVYFKSKDPIAKLQVQLRTVELGVPTSLLVQDYAAITLNPNEINVSDDASVPTTIRFSSPIYLVGGEMYSLVFLCPSSDKYEMWVATMGEKSVRTTNLPDVQNVVVSKQYLGGSLYKSQNGTIWTASQNQDLTFKLRKAAFVPSGTITLYNSPIEPGNFNCQVLPTNPIRSLPRKLKVSIDGSGSRTNTELPLGRKVSTGAATDPEDQSVTGIIEGQGSSISSEEVVSQGEGYVFTSNSAITTTALTGSGTGCTVDVTVSNEKVTAVAINASGNGYQVGDVLTVNNSDAKVTRGSGLKFTVTAISSDFDTLYLTDVQGEKFTNNENLVTYGASNTTRSVLSNVAVDGNSTVIDPIFEGNVMEVTQYNHAHHGSQNKIDIQNIKPDTLIVPTTSELTAESTVVSLANTAPFTSFSGISTDRGEALIEEEIVSYVVGTGQLSLTRGVLNTTALPHPEGASIQTYEASGVSLAGINTVFTVPTNTTLVNLTNIDNYYLEIDRSALDPSNTRTGNALLCFTNEKAFGGNSAKISQNHQYSSFSPQINFITPGTTTDLNTSVRTISGTSAGGNEISFVDQGFDPTTLNETTFFSTPRLIASTVNQDKLGTFPNSKSLLLNMSMSSSDPNLSPVIDTKNATFLFGRNKINNPIGFDNYATDSRTNQIFDDPHASVFVMDRVDLESPATSLKVVVAASVEPEADFRVFYRLFTADSSEVNTTYRAFPGFKNLNDVDGDGFGDDIIDTSLNNGQADSFVAPNRFNEFSEYQFTIDDVEQFNGFIIKIVMTSTNESVPVRLRDFRAIALA